MKVCYFPTSHSWDPEISVIYGLRCAGSRLKYGGIWKTKEGFLQPGRHRFAHKSVEISYLHQHRCTSAHKSWSTTCALLCDTAKNHLVHSLKLPWSHPLTWNWLSMTGVTSSSPWSTFTNGFNSSWTHHPSCQSEPDFLDSSRLGTETWDAAHVLACVTVSIKPCELLGLLLSDTLNADRQLTCNILL